LKTAFKILPANESTSLQNLFLEIGYEGISFVITSKSPFEVQGILIFNFDKNLTAKEIEEEINKITSSEPVLMQEYDTITINYNFPESALVPDKYFKGPETGPILSRMFGNVAGVNDFKEAIKTHSMWNVYRVDKRITETINRIYPGAVYYHSTSIQLQTLSHEVTCLHCFVYHNRIKVTLVMDNIIQLVQQFVYNTPADVAYHLLNACAQHDIPVEEVDCRLCGMIDEKSNLYNELYKYFLYINFQKLTPDIAVTGDILQYPPHFFSQLILSAKCVS